MSVRVGTWNVEYGRGAVKNRLRREILDAYDADVWVLTETNDDLDLPAPYLPVHSADRYLPETRGRWVTIWSRLPVWTRHETDDPARTVAVTLGGPDGPVCVFGTVLPWLQDKGPDLANPAPGWAEFARVTQPQAAEWRRLRALNPSTTMVVAGDLNQSLGGSHYYGTVAGRALLRSELASVGLECLTQTERFPPGQLDDPPIDHVCAGPPAGMRLTSTVSGWNKTHANRMVLSDHSGVVADIRLT